MKVRKQRTCLHLAIFALVASSVILGVVQNFIAADLKPRFTPLSSDKHKVKVFDPKERSPVFLINAWRFQICLLIFLCIAPALFLFDRSHRKYARLLSYLKILKSGRLKSKLDLEHLSDEELDNMIGALK